MDDEAPDRGPRDQEKPANHGSESGVDQAQIDRMLRMTPAERLRHMTQVARALAPIKGSARQSATTEELPPMNSD